MKIKELLLEYREIINRLVYGSWIDSETGQIYEVTNPQGHAELLMEISDLLTQRVGEDIVNQSLYKAAYLANFVRLVHSKGGRVTYRRGFEIESKKDAFKRVRNIIQPSFIGFFEEYPDGMVYLELFSDDDAVNRNSALPDIRENFRNISSLNEFLSTL